MHFCVCRARLQDRSAALTVLNILKLLKYEIIKERPKKASDNVSSFLRSVFHRFQHFVLATLEKPLRPDSDKMRNSSVMTGNMVSSVILQLFYTFIDQFQCFQRAHCKIQQEEDRCIRKTPHRCGCPATEG